MSRIAATFERLRSHGRKALIPYVTAGFPEADITPALMHAMVAAGADIIELGVPFSDPNADGPVVQRAGERALSLGVGLASVLEMTRVFRSQDQTTPVVLMGYANPIERYDQLRGKSRKHSVFVQDAAAAGIDGLLVVDYPPEECHDFAHQVKAAQMDMIFLLAPTSTQHRMQQIGRIASGYVYYVSLKGVTGSGALDVAAVKAMLPRIREHVNIPLGVGFGIRDGATACAIGQSADAVVIGSELLRRIENQSHKQALDAAGAFLREIRQALDAIVPK